jgi:hypothetical protein
VRVRERRLAEQENFTPSVKQPIAYEFKVVKLADLSVPDTLYQRPSSERAIRRIVDAGWDEGLQSVLMVSGNTMHIIDGGHRAEAARRLGITQLPALVYHGLTLEQEARYFVEFNRLRRPVGLKARQKASLLFGEGDAMAAQEILDLMMPKKLPLQTIVAANQRYPGMLKTLVPILQAMDTSSFSRDFISGLVHYAGTHKGRMSDEVVERLKEPGMFRRISEAIKQVMREHMRATGRTALPTDWSVKAEGVVLALNTRPALVPRETLIGD